MFISTLKIVLFMRPYLHIGMFVVGEPTRNHDEPSLKPIGPVGRFPGSLVEPTNLQRHYFMELIRYRFRFTFSII